MGIGYTLWFTGLPCCGKTTIANRVASYLLTEGLNVERLDGDIIRKTICRDLGFSKEDRNKNIERVIYISKLLTRNGVMVINTFISPYKKIRENARKEIGNFLEIYVDCPLDVCEKRDVKGMYAKARNGEIKNFTGVSDPYEKPSNPELILHTDKNTVNECMNLVLKLLKTRGIL